MGLEIGGDFSPLRIPTLGSRNVARMTRTTTRVRRRGAAYVFFLGTALLVTIIGMSALTIVRVKVRAAEGGNDSLAARLYAQSAIEDAMLAICGDAGWRDVITHDDWEPTQPIGRGSFTWKLVDEDNLSLTTDRNAPVRVYGQGVCGESVWIYSVLVQPPLESLPSSILVNGDFESGVASPWVGQNGAQVEVLFDTPHGGAAYACVKNRADLGSFPAQERTVPLVSGTTYRADCWVRLQDAEENVWFGVQIHTEAGWEYFEFAEAPARTSWTHLTGTIAPSWSGTADAVSFQVGTAVSDQEFMIDDVVLLKAPNTIGPIPGTWRREALP